MKYEAKITPMKGGSGSLKAFATVTIDGLIELTGWRVIEGPKGLFAAGPQTKGTKPDENGKDQYFDNIRFTDAEEGISPTKNAIQDTVLKAYGATLNTDTRGNTANARMNDPKPNGKRPSTQDTISKW